VQSVVSGAAREKAAITAAAETPAKLESVAARAAAALRSAAGNGAAQLANSLQGYSRRRGASVSAAGVNVVSARRVVVSVRLTTAEEEEVLDASGNQGNRGSMLSRMALQKEEDTRLLVPAVVRSGRAEVGFRSVARSTDK